MLTVLDWTVIVLYFGLVLWLGSHFGRKQKSFERYFLGLRNLPAWAVAFSMFSTIISSWAFLALPGKAFQSDLQYLMVVATTPLAVWITAVFLIPLYRNRIQLSAYEYLERRFGLGVRVYGNLAFLIVHFGKMAAILYLLCLAISSMTGWNLFLLIVIVGVVTLTYTFFGGIEGVIWTDVTQGILLLGAGLFSLFFLLLAAPSGPVELIQHAAAAHKFRLFTWEFSWASSNTYVLLFFGFNFYLQKYVSDQTVVQRFLLSSSAKAASRALWLSTFLIIGVWTIFMSVGVLLWAYYSTPAGLVPGFMISQPDQVFPYFIGRELPSGATGLILAGLFAATMSTLSSDLNSLASVLVKDYYERLFPAHGGARKLAFSRIAVLVAGMLAILAAMAMTRIHSMADAAFNFVALVGGGLLGIYLLGIFDRRSSARGIYVAIPIAIAVSLWAHFSWTWPEILPFWLPPLGMNTLWVGILANLIVVVAGFLASRLLSPGYQADHQLTVPANREEILL